MCFPFFSVFSVTLLMVMVQKEEKKRSNRLHRKCRKFKPPFHLLSQSFPKNCCKKQSISYSSYRLCFPSWSFIFLRIHCMLLLLTDFNGQGVGQPHMTSSPVKRGAPPHHPQQPNNGVLWPCPEKWWYTALAGRAYSPLNRDISFFLPSTPCSTALSIIIRALVSHPCLWESNRCEAGNNISLGMPGSPCKATVLMKY